MRLLKQLSSFTFDMIQDNIQLYVSLRSLLALKDSFTIAKAHVNVETVPRMHFVSS